MNRIYRLIWSESAGTLVPVSELVPARGKRSTTTISKAAAFLLSTELMGTAWAQAPPLPPNALPSGGQVTAGKADIQVNGSQMDINQSTSKAILNWNNFNIGSQAKVNFAQPDASSISLNRVIGSDPSSIAGQLNANGQVILINPNGVLFNRGAKVDTGGLVTSTLKLSDENFKNGNYHFEGPDNSAGITNQGTLTARDGGYISVIAPQIINEGTINTPKGTTALAAGKNVDIVLREGSLISVSVNQGTVDTLITNKNLIQADGGKVILTTKGRDGVLAGIINNQGIIQARTLVNQGGVIKLIAQGGTVNVAGTLDASAPNGGDGGFIETSGDRAHFDPNVKITTAAPKGKTGEWLIDPNDYTIASSGGDITAATLATNLSTSNVTIASSNGATAGSGNINVNQALTWSGSNSLTLNAVHSINVNQSINNSLGSGGIILRADSGGTCVAGAASASCGTVSFGVGKTIILSSGNAKIYYDPTGSNGSADANGNITNAYTSPTSFSTKVFSGTGTVTAYMLVNDVNQLQSIKTSLSGNYALGKNISATATSGWNSSAGFVP